MEYRLRLHPRIGWKISRWGLSEFLLMEAYIHLHDLPQDPMTYLHRDQDGPGNLFVFDARDPDSPDFNHIFMFRVFFDEDERHLNVVNASYWRNFDPMR